MELLERLFSLWETADRVGQRRRDRPLASVSLNGDIAGPQNPCTPVLAVAAVLAVALGRAVALQQAALSVVGILHRVLLPIHPVVVFYHTAKGGSTGFIWGSLFPVSCRSSWASPNAATGARGHSLCRSIPRGPWSCPLMSTHSKVPGWRSAQGLPVAPIPAEIRTRLAPGHCETQATISPQGPASASFEPLLALLKCWG